MRRMALMSMPLMMGDGEMMGIGLEERKGEGDVRLCQDMAIVFVES